MTVSGVRSSAGGVNLGTRFSVPVYSGAGTVSTPNNQSSARSGNDPLSSAQRAALIGAPVPIVFGRRVDGAGGVLISPVASDARFSNDTSNAVTAKYHLILSEGILDGIQVRDVFQQSCRVGTFSQSYDRRAGDWAPGNFIVAQPGFLDSVPDCPIYCGTGSGTYSGLTTASFSNTIPAGFTQWNRQVHMFIRGGIHVPRLLESGDGPSNNVADLLNYLMVRSARIPADLIDQSAMLEAATFTNANGLWANVEIDQSSNLAEWMTANLQYFLLRESRRNGKKGARPLLPFNTDGSINTGTVLWVATFTEDHVIPESVQIAYTSRADRMPFCAQVIWRQQPEDGLGLARTAEIRYSGSALNGPFEQHDLSEFCTTENHAFKVGTYILARRRYIDHRLTIELRPGIDVASLAPGDIVRVRLRRVASIGGNTLHDYLYEVDTIGKTIEGLVSLELTHFPVDDQSRSLVALDVSRAAGNGLMLPTGRADVSCDLNDADDETVPDEDGPWDEQPDPVPDPELYDPDTLDPELIDDVVDPGDGWGPGLEEDISDAFTEPDWGDDPLDPEPDPGWTDEEPDEEYIGTVSISAPLVVYPDVFYLVLEPYFARVHLTLSVDNPPTTGACAITIMTQDISFTAFIAKDRTSVDVSFLMGGVSIDECTVYPVVITSATGGGYTSTEISAEATYSICPYVGTVDPVIVEPWSREGGEWVWSGSSTDWSWTGTAWEWIGEGEQSGEPPSPEPDSLPPGSDYDTVVIRAAVDKMPIPNTANDLSLEISEDGSSVSDILVVPAVSRMFGPNWEYNPATDQWAYITPPTGWRWHSSEEAWQYSGSRSDEWEWDTAEERWNSLLSPIAGLEGEYVWDVVAQEWNWEGTGPEGSSGIDVPLEPPTSSPPVHGTGDSTFPPDASLWVWDPDEYEWTGDDYSMDGSPPVGPWYSNALTKHYQQDPE
jgi:hypothetical protein